MEKSTRAVSLKEGRFGMRIASLARIVVTTAVIGSAILAGSESASATVFPAVGTAPANGTGTCVSFIASGVTTVSAIIFESSVAQTYSLGIYTNSSCDTAHEVYQTGQAGAGAIIILNLPILSSGIWYSMTAWNGEGFRLVYLP